MVYSITGANIVAIKEAARVLRPGGRIRVDTGWLVPIAELLAAMRNAGFQYVRVTQKGFIRVTGRLRK